MSMDINCFYCSKSEKLYELMIEICKLKVSTVYLFKDQTYKGRCIVQFKDHKTELFQLTEEERNTFFEDVAKVASALYKVFSPDKLNYAILGDNLPHLHCNVIPKYKDNNFSELASNSEGNENYGCNYENLLSHSSLTYHNKQAEH